MRTPVAVCWVVALTALARPKSATLIRPSSAISTFSGLTSRWIRPARCAAASAETTGSSSASARAGESGASLPMVSRRVWPGISSMARKTVPSSLPWSKTATTLGCESRAAARASADEPGRELVVVAEPGVHHLDRDGAVQPQVDGLVDGRHAAAGDPRADPVAAVEHPAGEVVASTLLGRVARLLVGALGGMPVRRHGDLLHPDGEGSGCSIVRTGCWISAFPTLRASRSGFGLPRVRRRTRGCQHGRMTLAEADLAALVDEWLDWDQAAALLGVTPAKVRTMIRDHELAAAVSAARGRAAGAGRLHRETGCRSRGWPGCSRCSTTAGTTTARSSRGSSSTPTCPAGRSTRCARTAAPRSSAAPRRWRSRDRGRGVKWNRTTIKAVVIMFVTDHRDVVLHQVDLRPRRRDDHARSGTTRRPARPTRPGPAPRPTVDERGHRPGERAAVGPARRSSPVEGQGTLALIDQGGRSPSRQGRRRRSTTSRGCFPDHPRGYYAEYTVLTPGLDGPRRPADHHR